MKPASGGRRQFAHGATKKRAFAGGRTSILLTEDLRQVDRVIDALFPSGRLERERRARALRDGRELEKVASDDELSRGRKRRVVREATRGGQSE